ncbi:GAF domain-containing protein, partial [Phaeovulum sp.]|uniref:GAF domain-containing protein n=1 Tax=Phaeovulum sp. TaxID=2934796 RepID=UPI00356655B9
MRVDYTNLAATIGALTHGETDEVALMATLACEIHHADDRFDWTGFYRVVAPELMKIGPYQGGHGCLVIPFSRGVCGAVARSGKPMNVPDVAAFADHIACSSTTRSELVLPVHGLGGRLIGVL